LIFRSFGRKKNPESTPEVSVGQKNILCKTKLRFSKTRNSGFQKHEVLVQNNRSSVRKPEVSVQKPEVLVRKPEVSVQNPKASGKYFELETSVKVVFRNALVAETQNFELLCSWAKLNCVGFARLPRNIYCVQKTNPLSVFRLKNSSTYSVKNLHIYIYTLHSIMTFFIYYDFTIFNKRSKRKNLTETIKNRIVNVFNRKRSISNYVLFQLFLVKFLPLKNNGITQGAYFMRSTWHID
jgi:hypothetical protein